MSLPPQRPRAQGSRRAGPQVQHATLAVPLPVQPTAGECAALLKGIIKHLLFQRAQIPNLYDQLLRGVAEQQAAEEEAEEEEEAAAAGGGGRRRRKRRVPQGSKLLLRVCTGRLLLPLLALLRLLPWLPAACHLE